MSFKGKVQNRRRDASANGDDDNALSNAAPLNWDSNDAVSGCDVCVGRGEGGVLVDDEVVKRPLRNETKAERRLEARTHTPLITCAAAPLRGRHPLSSIHAVL